MTDAPHAPLDLVLWSASVRTHPFRDRLAAAVAGGFTSLAVTPHEVRAALADGLDAADLRGLAADAGVALSHLDTVTGWAPVRYPRGADAALVERFDVSVDDALALAAAIGARRVLALPGYETGDVPRAAAVAGFADLCDRAADAELWVDLEALPMFRAPHARRRLGTSSAALTGRTAASLLDTWHFARGGPDLDLLRSIPGERLRAVQLADGPARPRADTLLEDCLRFRDFPGEGDLDVVGPLQIVLDKGFLESVGPEVFSDDADALPAEEAGTALGRGHAPGAPPWPDTPPHEPPPPSSSPSRWRWPPARPPSRPPPPITPVRHADDYGYLARADSLASAQRTPLDAIKYVPLGPPVWGAGASHASFGGEVRLRPETTENLALDPAADDAWFLQRYAAHADLRLGSQLRLFGQLYSALQTGAARPGPVSRDALSVHEAFVEVAPVDRPTLHVALRVGRQEHPLGTGRLVELREGPNVRLSFDAARLLVAVGPPSRRLMIDAFVQRPVEADPGVFDDGRTDGEASWGLYATGPALRVGLAPEAYYVGSTSDAAFGPDGPRPTTRHTIGARLVTSRGAALALDAEAALQLGREEATDALSAETVRAGLVGLGVAYRADVLPLRLEAGLLLQVASGDGDPADGRTETFEPPHPENRVFGLAGVAGGLKNTVHLRPHLRATVPVLGGLTLDAAAALYRRPSTADTVYGPGKRPVAPAVGDARDVGRQVILDADLLVHRYVSVSARYERFWPGDALRDARPDAEPQDYASTTLLVRF